MKKVNVMKIKLSKNYLNHTAGDTIDVTAQRGVYLLKVKTAVESKEKNRNITIKSGTRKAKE